MSKVTITDKITDENVANIMEVKYENMTAFIITSNGYIQIASLFGISDRTFHKSFNPENLSSNDFIKNYSIFLPTHSPYTEIFGNKSDRILNGIYVHPDLAILIACSISPDSTIKIFKIINEWKNHLLSLSNEEIISLENIIESKELLKEENYESKYRDKIAAEENGIIGVNSKYGIIDVLTDTKIIDIKSATNYKHAIGQVQCYRLEFSDKELWIYLFDHKDFNKEIIKECCSAFNIKIKYIEE